MTNRIDNEISVGVDPMCLEWTRLAQKLQTKGARVVAGDFSNFDGSLQQEVLWEICDIINRWYDDGAENARIRIMLWEEVCNSRVLVQGDVIQQTHSQPSGNPMTVIINSIYNQIVMRMSYMICKVAQGGVKMCDFRDNVSMQCYGDDNVLNIRESILPWYNQKTIGKALEQCGMIYTDEAKSGVLVESRTLDQVEYLKRKFKRNTEGIYQAPLQLDVVREMVNWIKGNEPKRATEENVTTSLRELAQHGPTQYCEDAKVLKDACAKADCTVNFPLWKEWDNLWKSER